ncbi:hypothetical protein ACU686_18645 [Yinghuangia aomiensis]
MRRTDRPPQNPDDGTLVPAGPSGFVDTEARIPATTYHHRIGARFRDALGRPVDAHGVVRNIVAPTESLLAPGVRDLAVAADPFDQAGWWPGSRRRRKAVVGAVRRCPPAPPWQPGRRTRSGHCGGPAPSGSTPRPSTAACGSATPRARAVLAATVAGARCVRSAGMRRGCPCWCSAGSPRRTGAQNRWCGSSGRRTRRILEMRLGRTPTANPMTRIVDQAARRRVDEHLALPVGPGRSRHHDPAWPAADGMAGGGSWAHRRGCTHRSRGCCGTRSSGAASPGKRRVVVSVLSPHGSRFWSTSSAGRRARGRGRCEVERHPCTSAVPGAAGGRRPGRARSTCRRRICPGRSGCCA